MLRLCALVCFDCVLVSYGYVSLGSLRFADPLHMDMDMPACVSLSHCAFTTSDALDAADNQEAQAAQLAAQTQAAEDAMRAAEDAAAAAAASGDADALAAAQKAKEDAEAKARAAAEAAAEQGEREKEREASRQALAELQAELAEKELEIAKDAEVVPLLLRLTAAAASLSRSSLPLVLTAAVLTPAGAHRRSPHCRWCSLPLGITAAGAHCRWCSLPLGITAALFTTAVTTAPLLSQLLSPLHHCSSPLLSPLHHCSHSCCCSRRLSCSISREADITLLLLLLMLLSSLLLSLLLLSPLLSLLLLCSLHCYFSSLLLSRNIAAAVASDHCSCW